MVTHHKNIIAEYLTVINVKQVSHPSCSADLAPCNYPCPQFEKHLCGSHVSSSESVIKIAEMILDLSKNCLQHGFEESHKHWGRCIESNEVYFEEDHQNYEEYLYIVKKKYDNPLLNNPGTCN